MIARLHQWLAEQVGRPAAWGMLDCNTLVLSWLATCSGHRVIDEVAGRYTDEAEALAFARDYGRDLEAVLLAAGARGISEAELEPGDVVLVKDRARPWWRGHIIVDRDTFVAAWPGRGVRLAHRAYLRGSVLRFLRLPDAGGAPCLL